MRTLALCGGLTGIWKFASGGFPPQVENRMFNAAFVCLAAATVLLYLACPTEHETVKVVAHFSHNLR